MTSNNGKFESTPAHEAIYAAVTDPNGGNMIWKAVAGAGKTSTAIKVLDLIPASKKVVFLAFNKKIAEELQTRVPNHVKAQTINSLGHGAWMGWLRVNNIDVKAMEKADPKYRLLDADKVGKIAKKVCEANDAVYALGAVTRLVRLAKSEGVAPITTDKIAAILPDTDATWEGIIDHHDLETPERDNKPLEMAEWLRLAREVLRQSFAIKTTIDFDDQLYMTCLHRAKVTTYDWVICDEAQDFSALQHELISRAIAPNGGRIIAVGDPCQSIYGFRGAAHDSMERMAQRFNMKEYPLTVSYRCPQKVVEYAQQYVDYIQPHHTAPVGSVDDSEPMFWEVKVEVGDMVLSRFCAPLVSARLSLLQKGIPAVILGQDLAERLLRLVEFLKPRGIADLGNRLDKWEETEAKKARAKGKEAREANIHDEADCLRTFLGAGAKDLDALTALIKATFSDNPGARVTLATIHKSKGLEAKRVFLINFGATPSKINREWMAKQEDNLAYVAITRAKQDLTLVRMPRPRDRDA